MPKTSRAKLESNKRYIQKAYKKATISFRKEDLELIKSYCEGKNLSFNGFVTSTLMKAVLSDDGIDEE